MILATAACSEAGEPGEQTGRESSQLQGHGDHAAVPAAHSAGGAQHEHDHAASDTPVHQDDPNHDVAAIHDGHDDPVSGETFQLSTTGLRIVRLLRRNSDRDAVLAQILEEFEVDENTARRDVDQFLRSIEELGWEA